MAWAEEEADGDGRGEGKKGRRGARDGGNRRGRRGYQEIKDMNRPSETSRCGVSMLATGD